MLRSIHIAANDHSVPPTTRVLRGGFFDSYTPIPKVTARARSYARVQLFTPLREENVGDSSFTSHLLRTSEARYRPLLLLGSIEIRGAYNVCRPELYMPYTDFTMPVLEICAKVR